MKVRVYDKATDTYFKSEVYAIINPGWYEKYLVLVPSENEPLLKFYNYIDKTDKGSHPTLVNIIIPDYPSEWVTWHSDSVDEVIPLYNGLIDKNIKFFKFIGYPYLFDNKEAMISLLQDESIAFSDSVFDGKMLTSDLEGWNYIETQNDANMLMEQVNGFHDSILKKLNYISGGYVGSDGGMTVSDSIRQVIMFFDCQWCAPIELVFEGVVALNLRPAADNQGSNLFDASAYVNDASVFFCDCYLEKEDTSYIGTWIKAYSLRWRFI